MDIEHRVSAVPGRAAMRLVERRSPDGSWHFVTDQLEASGATADRSSPFDGLSVARAEPSMGRWLTTLQEQRRTVLVALVQGYDDERTFSHDTFDLDLDADLAACADAAVPLLLAIDEAIETVRAVVARPRGGPA